MSRRAGHQPVSLPHLFVDPRQHRLKLAVEHPLRRVKPPSALNGSCVERRPVHHDLLLDLLADPPQPLFLRIGPGAACQHLLHRGPDAIPIGDQRVAQGRLTHEADDGGGDVLVLGVCPGAAEVRLRVALLVEREAQSLSGPRGSGRGAAAPRP